MIACPQCGKLNPENFNYCLECGAELHPETTHSAESQFFIDLSADSPDVKKAKEDAKKVKAEMTPLQPAVKVETTEENVRLEVDQAPTNNNDEFSLDSLDDAVDELVAEELSEESSGLPPAAPKPTRPGEMVLELSPDDLDDALDVPVVNRDLSVRIEGVKEASVKTDNLPDAGSLLKDMSVEEIDVFDAEPEVVELTAENNVDDSILDLPDVPGNVTDKSAEFTPENVVEEESVVDINTSPAKVTKPTSEPEYKSDNKLEDNMSQNEDYSCAQCGAALKPDDRFCGKCGASTDAATTEDQSGKTMFMSIEEDAEKDNKLVGKLIIQEPSGRDGRAFNLVEGENLCGRNSDPVKLDDNFVSPAHCSFVYADGQMVVRDKDSLNGVFIKLKGEIELTSRTSFRIGQQLMLFLSVEDFKLADEAKSDDDTKFLGSPKGSIWGKVLHITSDGNVLASYPLKQQKLLIGRESGDITFAHDGFVSGKHASLSYKDGKCYLKDLASSNGSFVKVSEHTIKDNDLVLIGKKLMRLELVYKY